MFLKLLAISIATATAVAQDLVFDINATLESGWSSIPQSPCVVGNQLFFSADDGSFGRELWVTDGTAAGTVMAADLTAGSDGSNPARLTAFAGGLAFIANDTMYHGTAAPFVPLGPANPGVGLQIAVPTVLGQRLCYAATDAASGTELWSTDGTPAGTARLTDLAPGSANADPNELTIGNGLLWFSAMDGSGNRRLFRSDGTTAGTFDVAPAASYGPVTRIVAAGGFVFFGSYNTNELWRTDGTAGGTVLLRGGFTAGPNTMAAVGNQIVFVAADAAHGYEPWVSDGTVAGTQLLLDVWPGPSGSLVTGSFVAIGSQVMFTAFTPAFGREPWISDLTPGGTTLLRDIAPNATSSSPSNVRAVQGVWWFGANDGVTGPELWRSDGTTIGTQRIEDINSGASIGSFPTEFTAFGGEVFFAANQSPAGREPWLSNGTSAGTRLLKDIGGPARGSDPWVLGRLGKRTVLSAEDAGNGREPWITDGTSTGTQLLADLAPGPQDSTLRPLGEWQGRFWFWTQTAGVTLWATDGTSLGTVAMRNFPTARWIWFSELGDKATLIVEESAQYELWVTDGSATGTQQINVPAAISPLPLVAFGGHVYFGAHTAAFGAELWRTDGTQAGTAMFVDLDPGPASSAFTAMTAIGDRLYFGAANTEVTSPFPGVIDYEPWISDGTVAGTVRLADLNPGTASAVPNQFVRFNGLVWFTVSLGSASNLLCGTDGTPGGTFTLMSIFGPPTGINQDLVVAGDRLFFQHDGELWSSDGTLTGTALAADITPGFYRTNPEWLVPLGASRKLVFAATLPFESQSLWLSDGTQAGTSRLGAGLSEFSLPTRSGSDVFFAASDAAAGRELRALRLRSVDAAMADVVGEGCAGGLGAPAMRVDAGPLLGSTFMIHLDGALPVTPAFLAFAVNLLPNGDRTPCTVGLDPSNAIVTLSVTDGAGHSVSSVAIPTSTAVLGIELWSQWLAVDPAGGFLGSFSLSPLLDWIVGS